MINDLRGIVYAPEYPDQIRDLVWAAEDHKQVKSKTWHQVWGADAHKPALPRRISVVNYLKSLDFKRCKRDAMISLSLRVIYRLGSQTSVWNSTVERARKELLSRGLDADKKLAGLVRKSKTSI